MQNDKLTATLNNSLDPFPPFSTPLRTVQLKAAHKHALIIFQGEKGREFSPFLEVDKCLHFLDYSYTQAKRPMKPDEWVMYDLWATIGEQFVSISNLFIADGLPSCMSLRRCLLDSLSALFVGLSTNSLVEFHEHSLLKEEQERKVQVKELTELKKIATDAEAEDIRQSIEKGKAGLRECQTFLQDCYPPTETRPSRSL